MADKYNYAEVFHRYGSIKPGVYRVVSKQRDHYIIKVHGQNWCVPFAFFEK